MIYLHEVGTDHGLYDHVLLRNSLLADAPSDAGIFCGGTVKGQGGCGGSYYNIVTGNNNCTRQAIALNFGLTLMLISVLLFSQ